MVNTDELLRLVADQNSPENNLRKAAELAFSEKAAQNPSQVAYELILAAAAPEDLLSLVVRQSCLLHLKRLVPKYWSMGFPAFQGPPIDQELKTLIRQSLIELAISATLLKIRLGSAYVIVQIAAADYPDEWPDLLTQLYQHTTDFNNATAVRGGLTVLTDLFDDLITEEQFWEGGVGNQLITHITHMLGQPQLSPDIKSSALKLYLTVFNTLLSSEATALKERRSSVNSHMVFLSELLLSALQQLFQKSSTGQSLELVEINYRYYLYKTFAHVLSVFPKQVSRQVKSAFLLTMIEDFTYAARIFGALLVDGEESIPITKTEDLDDPAKCVVNYTSELLTALSILLHSVVLSTGLDANQFKAFASALVSCSIYPKDTIEDFSSDFNLFVTDATGLSAHATVRDAIADFLGDLNDQDATHIFEAVKTQCVEPSQDWKTKEAYLLIVECLFLNESAEAIGSDLPLASFLSSINNLISVPFGPYNNPLVVARIFLLLPRFIENFKEKLSVNTFGAAEFKNTLAYATSNVDDEAFDLVKASALVSTTLWKNISELELTQLGNELQIQIFNVAYSLLEDSEEDTLPVLLEAASVGINISHQNAFNAIVSKQFNVLDLIFKISFKDPANVQLTIDSAECLEILLENVLMEVYLQVCKQLVPFILDIINSSLSQEVVEYSPELYLALELLGYIIGGAPSEPGQDPSNSFPSEVFLYIFPLLKNLILRTSDDQILQNAGEVFNNLLQKASKLFMEYTDPKTKQSGLDLLLEIASKFLSTELSDSAAMNCGLIVISLFEHFQPYLNSGFFMHLLRATVIRLDIAKELITIENLIMVFCKLVLNTSPEQVIDVLTGLEFKNEAGSKNGLQVVLPIWFNAFEVTRGYEKIKQNILALGKIFSLNDERVSSMIVDGKLIPYDGDLIITRSMSKRMPQKYVQVPAPVKILELLAGELEFQCEQPDPKDYLPEEVEEGDGDEEWEDMDDIGVPNYEKLKTYVESDDEEEAHGESDQGIKDLLVQFFKECTSKNLGNFQKYYEALDEQAKKVITESIVF